MMRRPDVVDTTTITHNMPIETPFVPQYIGEQMAVPTAPTQNSED